MLAPCPGWQQIRPACLAWSLPSQLGLNSTLWGIVELENKYKYLFVSIGKAEQK